tara:strand:+ start:332 stop:1258 length:927 start_codon:yes stop_codon:yes gene_type:complete
MNFKQKSIIFILLFITSLNNTLAKENKILVKVNNKIITSVDILNEINFLSFLNKEFGNINKNQQIQIAKNSLIKDKIKSIEILKFKKNLSLEDKNFEKIMKNYFRNQNIDNQTDFEILFKKNNLDFEFVREKISIDTFWKGLIYEKFYRNVKIDESEIKKNILKKEKQNEYMLSEIVFTLNKEEKLNQKFQKITNIIKKRNFAEAALNFSVSDTSGNGGELGWIKENVLNKNIKNELKIINNGEFTNPIVIPGGFLILYKKQSREIKNSLDVNNEIKSIINKKTNDQLNRFSNIYLKKLRKNIQINEF